LDVAEFFVGEKEIVKGRVYEKGGEVCPLNGFPSKVYKKGKEDEMEAVIKKARKKKSSHTCPTGSPTITRGKIFLDNVSLLVSRGRTKKNQEKTTGGEKLPRLKNNACFTRASNEKTN